MRLDKFLGNLGVGSRQDVKKIIKNGRVKVNGEIVHSPEKKISEGTDLVTLDGRELVFQEFYYILLYKPAGYVCSAHEKGQTSVLSLIKETYADKLFPVGRLDKDTEGLLLLTNDGKLSHELLSPVKHVDKKYYVELKERVRRDDILSFEEGIDIGDDKLTLPAVLEPLGELSCMVTIREGRFHQIKRMFAARNNEVIYLKRMEMKNLRLEESLKPGDYRPLTEKEIEGLRKNDK